MKDSAGLQTGPGGPVRLADIYLQEPAMNPFRISFLVATDVAMIAMLAALLTGCVSVSTPQQYRNGDFVSHMAAAESKAHVAAAGTAEAPRVLVTQSSRSVQQAAVRS
jgi:hypothetical protein